MRGANWVFSSPLMTCQVVIESNHGPDFQKRDTFYIRGTIIIEALDWKIIQQANLQNKKKCKIPIHKEIKWFSLWTKFKSSSKGINIPDNKPE